MRANGMGMRRIAREAGLGIGTVLRLVNSGPRLLPSAETRQITSSPQRLRGSFRAEAKQEVDRLARGAGRRGARYFQIRGQICARLNRSLSYSLNCATLTDTLPAAIPHTLSQRSGRPGRWRAACRGSRASLRQTT